MPKSKKTTKLPLFDIRVNSLDKDTILLKGPVTDAPPTLLSGTIALSVTEPLHVRKMKLKLYATLSFNWDEKYHTGKGQTVSRPFRFMKMIYCFDWDPLNLERFLHTHDPLYSQFLSRASSSNSLDNIKNGIGFTTGTLIRSNHGSSSNLTRIGSSTTLNSIGSLVSIPGLSPSYNAHANTNTTANANPGAGANANAMAGSNASHNYGHTRTHSHSKSFSNLYNKSASNLSSKNLSSLTSLAAGVTSHEPVILQPGNYEFPFQCILDGTVPESIVDHPCCSLVYRLQCTIERGRFSVPIITRKLIHVVRTLTPDNPELSETVAVDNTWPNKVDYSISVPTKAIAIGSSTNVHLNLAPLCKGLKLGSIKVKLVEYASFSTASGQHNSEKVLTTKHIPKVTTNSEGLDIWSDEAPMDEDGVFYRSNSLLLSNDRWEINTNIQLPPSLESMTQDLDILNLCKIRHKLKFSVGLINTDGHVSELRATLPVTLFISPFVPIKVKTIGAYDDPFKTSAYEDVSIHTLDEKTLFQNEDVTAVALHALYDNQQHHNNVNQIPEPDGTVSAVNINTQDLMAPPNYDDRVYDRVFNVNSSSADDPPSEITNNDAYNITENSNNPAAEVGNVNNNTTTDSADVTMSLSPEFDHGRNGIEDDLDSTLDDANLDPFAARSKSSNSNQQRKYKKPIFSIASDDEEEDSLDCLDPFDVKSSRLLRGPSETSRNSDYVLKDNGDKLQTSGIPQLSAGSPLPQSNVISGPAFSSGEKMSITNIQPDNHLLSPGTLSPVEHLSRATSFIGDAAAGFGLSALQGGNGLQGNGISEDKFKEMIRPPSYDVAIHSVASAKDLTPIYDNPDADLREHLHVLDSRLQSVRLSQLDHQGSPPNQYSKSTTALNHQLKMSKRYNYSHSLLSHHVPQSPPVMSRNISSSSLLSKRPFKGGSVSHDNSDNHFSSAANYIPISTNSNRTRFELGSPGVRSASSTPGLSYEGSYFPPQDLSASSSVVDFKNGVLNSPKAAFLGDSNASNGVALSDMVSSNHGGNMEKGIGINLNNEKGSGLHTEPRPPLNSSLSISSFSRKGSGLFLNLRSHSSHMHK